MQAPDIWDVETANDSQEWGNKIHLALSKLKYADELDAVINEIIQEGIFIKDEIHLIRKLILDIINHEELHPYFSRNMKVLNESEIILPNGKTYRPDRVIIDKNDVVVIDYKTGHKKDFYQNQMKHYGKLLAEMNYNVRKKWIVYLGNHTEIVEVN